MSARETRSILVCSDCGSDDVELVVWMHANTGAVGDPVGSCTDPDDNWCHQCDAHVELVERRV